jgi:hypothetical protein
MERIIFLQNQMHIKMKIFASTFHFTFSALNTFNYIK